MALWPRALAAATVSREVRSAARRLADLPIVRGARVSGARGRGAVVDDGSELPPSRRAQGLVRAFVLYLGGLAVAELASASHWVPIPIVLDASAADSLSGAPQPPRARGRVPRPTRAAAGGASCRSGRSGTSRRGRWGVSAHWGGGGGYPELDAGPLRLAEAHPMWRA